MANTEREKSIHERLREALYTFESARDNLAAAMVVDDVSKDRGDNWEVRKLIVESQRKHSKTIMADVIERCQEALAKSERERDDLIKQAARGLY